MSANGKTEHPPAPSPEQLAASTEAIQKLEAPLRQVIGTMMRGLLVSTPGVAPHVVLNAICWQVGHLAAEVIQADLKTTFEIRRSFKASFDAGVGKARVVQPMAAPAG